MLNISRDNYTKAAEILKDGGLVAFPTETVYGLGCICTREDCFNRLVKVKRRSPDKPFTLMCSNIKQIKKYAVIDSVSEKIIKKFLPGPLTIVIKSKPGIPSYLDLNSGYVGFRIPKSDFVLKMIDLVGEPLLVPSANLSNFPPAKDRFEVFDYFHDSIDGIVEGEGDSNIPSTVIKVEDKKVTMLRQGAITLEEIEEAIK